MISMNSLIYTALCATVDSLIRIVNVLTASQTIVQMLKCITTSLAWTYIKVCGYSDSFCKNLNQRSLTPRWPLTPHLLRSYVWLYRRITVSKSHENTSKYVDTVTFFAKTWSEGHWPLDDLWPHVEATCVTLPKDHCVQVPWKYIKVCGYSDPLMTFDPTSVEVTRVTLPKDHCVQVPWEYINVCRYCDQFCKNYHIHTCTYYVQNQWSHSLFLNYVQELLSGETIKPQKSGHWKNTDFNKMRGNQVWRKF